MGSEKHITTAVQQPLAQPATHLDGALHLKPWPVGGHNLGGGLVAAGRGWWRTMRSEEAVKLQSGGCRVGQQRPSNRGWQIRQPSAPCTSHIPVPMPNLQTGKRSGAHHFHQRVIQQR